MKFGTLVEICLWPHLAVKGLIKKRNEMKLIFYVKQFNVSGCSFLMLRGRFSVNLYIVYIMNFSISLIIDNILIWGGNLTYGKCAGGGKIKITEAA